jgi:hypothetical protein
MWTNSHKAYAAAMGVTERTAQRHRKKRHPDWEKFVGTSLATAVDRQRSEGAMLEGEAELLAAVSPVRPAEPPEFVDEDDEGLEPVQLNEKRAWQIHDQTFRKWRALLSDPLADPVMPLGFARELPKLREDYEKARAARERWEIEQRRLITRHEFEGFVGQFLVPMAEMLKNLAAELPVVMNPENPGMARDRLVEWQRAKMQPQIEQMLEGAAEFASTG